MNISKDLFCSAALCQIKAVVSFNNKAFPLFILPDKHRAGDLLVKLSIKGSNHTLLVFIFLELESFRVNSKAFHIDSFRELNFSFCVRGNIGIRFHLQICAMPSGFDFCGNTDRFSTKLFHVIKKFFCFRSADFFQFALNNFDKLLQSLKHFFTHSGVHAFSFCGNILPELRISPHFAHGICRKFNVPSSGHTCLSIIAFSLCLFSSAGFVDTCGQQIIKSLCKVLMFAVKKMFEFMPQSFKGIHAGVLPVNPEFIFSFIIPTVDSITGGISCSRSPLFIKVSDIKAQFLCHLIHQAHSFICVFDFSQSLCRLRKIFRQGNRPGTICNRGLSFRSRSNFRSNISSVRHSSADAAKDSAGNSTSEELFPDIFPGGKFQIIGSCRFYTTVPEILCDFFRTFFNSLLCGFFAKSFCKRLSCFFQSICGNSLCKSGKNLFRTENCFNQRLPGSREKSQSFYCLRSLIRHCLCVFIKGITISLCKSNSTSGGKTGNRVTGKQSCTDSCGKRSGSRAKSLTDCTADVSGIQRKSRIILMRPPLSVTAQNIFGILLYSGTKTGFIKSIANAGKTAYRSLRSSLTEFG